MYVLLFILSIIYSVCKCLSFKKTINEYFSGLWTCETISIEFYPGEKPHRDIKNLTVFVENDLHPTTTGHNSQSKQTFFNFDFKSEDIIQTNKKFMLIHLCNHKMRRPFII